MPNNKTASSQLNAGKITLVINGNSYQLNARDGLAIRNMPSSDRQALLALLETVKQQEQLSQKALQQAVAKAALSSSTSTSTVKHPTQNQATTQAASQAKPERLGSGDIDALMAKLIMEEKAQQKAMPTKQGLYKWVIGIALVAFVLIIIF